MQIYFNILGIDPNDTGRLFNLLDDDGSGEVSTEEFVTGCLRLKGDAKSIDVYGISRQCTTINAKVSILEDMLGCRKKKNGTPISPSGSEITRHAKGPGVLPH